MHSTRELSVAYVLESISPGWLTYEIDALMDAGCGSRSTRPIPAAIPGFGSSAFPTMRPFPKTSRALCAFLYEARR